MSDICFILKYSWIKAKSLIGIIILQNIFSALWPIVNIIGFGMVIDALTVNKTYDQILNLITIYTIINLLISITSASLTYIQQLMERNVSNIMQFDFSEDAININYHYVQDGTILDLKKKSMRVNPAISLQYFGKLLNYIVQFAGVLFIFSRLSPIFVIVLIVMCTLSVFITFKNRKIIFVFKNDRVENDRKMEYLYKVMTEYRFAKEVRLNNAGEFIEKKYKIELYKLINKLKKYYTKVLALGLVNVIIMIIQSVTMYLFFSYQVYSSQITIAEYTALLASTTLLTSLLLEFFDNIANIADTCKSVSLYREYLDTINKNSTIIKSNNLPEIDVSFKNPTLVFENVSFTYPNTNTPILKNINLKIESDEHVGIVGLNGSGKTTLVKLLTRIYDPDEGSIKLNGIDIRNIPYWQYSSYIGVVLQDFLLFAYSIKENFAFDNPINNVKLLESIEKSGLKNKIDSLRNGIDTIIYKQLDDNGIEFSGGESQKLALARAIYKNASIMLLDEPTSALDPLAEYELFSHLSDIADKKTAIFISHRLSSTRFCNKIIVLEDGTITEIGNHDELIDINKTYAYLFNAQAKYYQE